MCAGIAQLVERNLAKVVAGRAASTVPATTAVDKRDVCGNSSVGRAQPCQGCGGARSLDGSGDHGGGYTQIRAGIAQLVERNLAKVEVAGSNPVSRSNSIRI